MVIEMGDRAARDKAGLTPSQRRVLVTVAELRTELGRCPEVREVCKLTGVQSTNDMHQRLLRLVNLGYLQRGDIGQQRTLQPTDLGWQISGVDSGGLTLVGVERPLRCPTCAAVTFKPHKPETCQQLITGEPYE